MFQTHEEKPSDPNKVWRRAYVLLLTVLVGTLFFFPPPNGPLQASAADPDYYDPPSAVSRGGVSPSVPGRGGSVDSLTDLDSGAAQDARPGGTYPLPPLERVFLKIDSTQRAQLQFAPKFSTALGESMAGMTGSSDVVFFTVNPELQNYVERLVAQAKAPHVAVVAMEPRTGKVLAIAGKSVSLENAALHSGFPAASVFKVITTAAALEEGIIEPNTEIAFRGGTYTLERWNYLPDGRRDTRSMSVSEALGRSCNPVFGRLAMHGVNSRALTHYAAHFGFNTPLGFDLPMISSSAFVPEADMYELSRTAAGFGDVTLSPVHAATFMSGVANGGLMPRPYLVDKVVSMTGAVRYRSQPQVLRRMISTDTSTRLLNMMEASTTLGTSRKEFMSGNRPILGDIRVAGKTGTLSGLNPKGLNNWFVAAAPIDDPKIAIAVITVNAHSSSSKASALGRRVIQRFLLGDDVALAPTAVYRSTYTSKSKSKWSSKSSSKKPTYRSISSKKASVKSKSTVVSKSKAKVTYSKSTAKAGSSKSAAKPAAKKPAVKAKSTATKRR